MKSAAHDVTVLRSDPSVTGTGGAGRGGASPPRVLKQRFVLDDKLGSGGMGTVFRAKDLRKVEARDRHPYVAVKVLNNDFREHPEAFIALQREATKSQALSHRNIVTIYDFDKDGDVPFIIMELLEGQELADLLRAYPTGLPDEMVWTILRCLCEGLEHAHEAGLVHADFKPGNVFVAPNHSAKILDFGIARAVQINQALGEDTVFDPTRLAALTPAYASPQMLDGAEAEQRDDLFSLGVVAYLMLTGNHPYGRTPANEAAREGLRPERPRRLTRRQWRVIERCLAFDREARPASLAEVKVQLFQPSPWRSRTALVAAAVAVLTFALSGFKEEAAVEEARVEVRQTTLVDSQLARLRALVAAPAFDATWEDKVAEEVAILRSLHPPEAAGTPEAAEAPVLVDIRRRYADEIMAARDLERAVAIYQRALAYGPLPEVEAWLGERLAAQVVALLDDPALETGWMDALDNALGRLEGVFPASSQAAALRLETADVLGAELEASIAADEFPPARRALDFLETYSFDPEMVEALTTRVDDAERAYLARRSAEARRAALAEFRAELKRALAGPCLAFEPDRASRVFRAWVGRQPSFADAGRAQVGEHVARCAAQLETLDRTRALGLKNRAVALFGPLPGLDGQREDPCAAEFLVGSGSQGGRRGSCADPLGEGGQGPRLVVVPGADDVVSFAITRQEVSWGELKLFCGETGACGAVGQDAVPVAGVPVEVAREYARWLSGRTGFHYRLPTHDEWLRAARDTRDPNRNCQVQLGGVHRGVAPVTADTGTPNTYGLVNVLGNVQEWVQDGERLRAAGGAYRDPIEQCAVDAVRDHAGTADSATGFRLVRELT